MILIVACILLKQDNEQAWRNKSVVTRKRCPNSSYNTTKFHFKRQAEKQIRLTRKRLSPFGCMWLQFTVWSSGHHQFPTKQTVEYWEMESRNLSERYYTERKDFCRLIISPRKTTLLCWFQLHLHFWHDFAKKQFV